MLAGGGSGGRRKEAEAWGRRTSLRPIRALFLSPRSLQAARALGGAPGSRGARGRQAGPGRARSAEPRRAPRPRLLTAAAGLELSALGCAASAPSGSLPSAPTPPAPVRLVSQLLSPRARLFSVSRPLLLEYFAPSIWGEGLERGRVERPEEKEARAGGGGRESADRGEETPRHPFWSSSLPPRPCAHSLPGELLSDEESEGGPG